MKIFRIDLLIALSILALGQGRSTQQLKANRNVQKGSIDKTYEKSFEDGGRKEETMPPPWTKSPLFILLTELHLNDTSNPII